MAQPPQQPFQGRGLTPGWPPKPAHTPPPGQMPPGGPVPPPPGPGQAPPSQPQQGYQPQQGQMPPGQQPPGQQQFPGQHPLPGNQSIPGQQQFPGQQPPPGYPPMPGQQSLGQQSPGQQSPGQQSPGQQSFPGQQPPPGYQPRPAQQFPGQQRSPGHRGPVSSLADGEWHRLSPMTPWSTAIPILIAIIGTTLAIGAPMILAALLAEPFDSRGRVSLGVPVIMIVGMLLVAVLAAGWPFLSYRFATFRLGDDIFEMRQGVLFKQHRQVRLDRLQSVNLNRPIGARFFGLTQLETAGAGADSDIKLMYIKRDDAEALRAEILRRASGARQARVQAGAQQAPSAAPMHPSAAPQAAHPGAMPTPQQASGPQPAAALQRPRRVLADFIDAAILDISDINDGPQVPEHAVVRVAPARIVGSTALTLGLVLGIIVLVMGVTWAIIAAVQASVAPDARIETDLVFGWTMGLTLLMTAIAAFFGMLGSLLSSLQYTIAGTQDGLRIGKGVLNKTSDTVAPGRIHAVQINQSILWRPFKWYSVTVSRADLQMPTNSSNNGENSNALSRQTLLPVGTLTDVQRVLALALPMHQSAVTPQLIEAGMASGRRPEFVAAPARAWWLKPLAFRRLGYAIDRGVMYLRSGWLIRRLAIIPGERMQGVTMTTGPLRRAARVVTLGPDIVQGQVSHRLPLVDAEGAIELHDRVEQLAITAAQADTSHRWREAQARLTVNSARMQVDDARSRGEQPDPRALWVLRAEEEWMRSQQGQSAQPAHPGQPGQPAQSAQSDQPAPQGEQTPQPPQATPPVDQR